MIQRGLSSAKPKQTHTRPAALHVQARSATVHHALKTCSCCSPTSNVVCAQVMACQGELLSLTGQLLEIGVPSLRAEHFHISSNLQYLRE